MSVKFLNTLVVSSYKYSEEKSLIQSRRLISSGSGEDKDLVHIMADIAGLVAAIRGFSAALKGQHLSDIDRKVMEVKVNNLQVEANRIRGENGLRKGSSSSKKLSTAETIAAIEKKMTDRLEANSRMTSAELTKINDLKKLNKKIKTVKKNDHSVVDNAIKAAKEATVISVIKPISSSVIPVKEVIEAVIPPKPIGTAIDYSQKTMVSQPKGDVNKKL